MFLFALKAQTRSNPMKIKKGLPPGYISVRKDLQPLVEKMHQLKPNDLRELEAFMDYLQRGAEKFSGTEPDESKSLKIYEFMNGGLEKEESSGSNTPDPEVL